VHGSNAVLPVLLIEREHQTPREATFFEGGRLTRHTRNILKTLRLTKQEEELRHLEIIRSDVRAIE
jgi:hypothetical protein